jgi:hypothetical protein
MPSLINIANQLKVTSAFANLHDTFSREITVYKNSKQVTIASSAQYNSIYGNAGAYSNTQNQIVSSTFMARIYYIKMDEEFLSDSASNKGSQNKIIIPQGSVKIVVDPTGYLFIKEARKVEFDGKTFSIKSDGVPMGLFENQYYEFFLTPLDE